MKKQFYQWLIRICLVSLPSVFFMSGCISGCELDFAHGCAKQHARERKNSIKQREQYLKWKRERLEAGKVAPENIEYEKKMLKEAEEDLQKDKEKYGIK